MTKQQRSRLVVEPAIQYSLVRQMVGHWLLFLIASAILITMLQVLLGGVFRPWDYHFQRIWPMVASQAVALLFLCPTFILSSLKLSNRFVGPIHRLRKQLRQVAAGDDVTTLHFRNNDYWTVVAGELERALQAAHRQGKDDCEVVPAANSSALGHPGTALPLADAPVQSDTPIPDNV